MTRDQMLEQRRREQAAIIARNLEAERRRKAYEALVKYVGMREEQR
jgi:hypothetical protein